MVATQFSDKHSWAVAMTPVTLPGLVVAVLLEDDNFSDQQISEANVAAVTRRITEAILRLPSFKVGGS